MEIPKSFKIDFTRDESGEIHEAPPPNMSEMDMSEPPQPPQESGDPPVPPSPPTPDVEPDPEGASPEEGLILGKYKNQQELEAAYKALEARLGAQDPAPVDEPQDASEEPTDAPVDSQAAFQKYVDEYAENGALSDESYAQIEQNFGLPRSFVDQHVAGQRALQEKQTVDLLSEAGIKSKDEHVKITEWAASSLNEAEVKVFNETVKGGDRDAVLAAWKGLVARYQVENKPAARRVSGRKAPSGPPGYSSSAEMQQEMRDPRYQYDVAFRKAVEDRIARTPDAVFGGRVSYKGPQR